MSPQGEKSLRAIARDEFKNDQGMRGRGRAHRWLYFAGMFTIVLALAISALTTERQAAWEDEIFAVSTGWSLARSRPPILSVLAQYPGTGSPIKFYGPISFEAEASLIRLFGLSLSLWRMACVAGVAFSIWAAMRLVSVAGGDKVGGADHRTDYCTVRIPGPISGQMGCGDFWTILNRPALLSSWG